MITIFTKMNNMTRPHSHEARMLDECWTRSDAMLMNAVKWGSFVKTHVIDVNTSRTPEAGAHSPSWPNGLIISTIFMNAESMLNEC